MSLAKLEIQNSEKEFYCNQISQIQTIIGKVTSIECDQSVQPMITVHPLPLQGSPDVLSMRNTREEILNMSPLDVRSTVKIVKAILAPKVIE